MNREVILMDETTAVTTLTLWNQDVSRITGGENAILSIARAKTSIFRNAVSSFLTETNEILIDPPHARTSGLKTW